MKKLNLKDRLLSFFSGIRKRWKWILLLILIIAGIGWRQYSQQQNNQPVLKFEKPQREDLVKTLDVSGVLDAKEKARLRFAVGGKVTRIGAKEGDWVKKYQTIATIDQATLNKQLQQDLNMYLKERYSADHYIVDNKDKYFEEPVVRDKQFNQIDLENEVLNVEIRDIAIRNTVLSAPFAGILTVAPTTVPGVQLLGSDYFEVVNPETLVFRAEVDEVDIAAVSLNQPATIQLDAFVDENIYSQVNYVAFTSTQTSSGTIFLVELPIPATDLQKYRIGMNGDVSIKIGTAYNALTIPLVATREHDGKIFVDVKNGENTTQEREITTGLTTDEKVEVRSGLSESDEILIPE